MVIQPETILIVGASGFLGEATSRYCVKQGMATIGIDIVAPDANIAYTSFYRTEQLESTLGPILEKWRPNYLINLAGNADVGKSMSHPRNDFKKSVELFSVILEQVRHFSIDTKVMLASSAAVYGQPKRLPIDESEMPQPLSPYGYHKWLCELLAKEYSEIYGLKIASARIFSAYGSGLKKQILWDLCHKCSNAGLIELDGDGSESRDFIHAEDIAIAMLCILRGAKYVGESYNVGSGQEISISTLAHLVIKQFDIPSERLVFSHADRIGDPRNWRADITKLQLLGFVPTVDFSKGVARYVNWFKEK